MWGYEAARPRRSMQRQTGFTALLATLLALPVLAGEPAPPSQSDDPAIAAALRYEQGDGVARNPGRAAEMYCAAAHLGNADAAYRLGWMYAEGDGVERDDRQAAALFQRAAALGHGPAARKLDGMQMSDARMPLCITLAPPPPITVELDADGKPLMQEKPEAAPAVAPASTPAASATEAPVPDATQSVSVQLAVAIERWADAWSLRDVDRYLAAYAPDFQPPHGESRQKWERQRRTRIAGKTRIDIQIRDLAITVDGDVARARFVQEYRADRRRETALKTLTLIKSERTWLIRQEESEALPPQPIAR
jgi:TPR repeat protein